MPFSEAFSWHSEDHFEQHRSAVLISPYFLAMWSCETIWWTGASGELRQVVLLPTDIDLCLRQLISHCSHLKVRMILLSGIRPPTQWPQLVAPVVLCQSCHSCRSQVMNPVSYSRIIALISLSSVSSNRHYTITGINHCVARRTGFQYVSVDIRLIPDWSPHIRCLWCGHRSTRGRGSGLRKTNIIRPLSTSPVDKTRASSGDFHAPSHFSLGLQGVKTAYRHPKPE